MTTTRRKARVAGFLYLSLLIFGPIRLIVIPGRLFVEENAAATAHNIATHELLFRLGMVSDLCGAVLLILLTLALYRLFEAVSRTQAVLVVILGGVMPAAIYFFNVVNDAAALTLIRGADFLAVFDRPQREALAMLFLRLHDHEVVAAELLWGLWLFPLGVLAYRSRFLPRFLGVWLGLGGVSYVVLSFTGLLAPRYADLVFRIGSPARLGELAFMLWLAIIGAREPRAAAAAA